MWLRKLFSWQFHFWLNIFFVEVHLVSERSFGAPLLLLKTLLVTERSINAFPLPTLVTERPFEAPLQRSKRGPRYWAIARSFPLYLQKQFSLLSDRLMLLPSQLSLLSDLSEFFSYLWRQTSLLSDRLEIIRWQLSSLSDR